ncbi:MAG: hypothetical protein ABI330_09400 [Caldimonas sp.]
MEDTEVAQRARFAQVVEALRSKPNVTCDESNGKTFGQSALKVNGKIFAMISSSDRFVVKLPKLRVDELEAQGIGKKFEVAQGRPLKEWLSVDPDSRQKWSPLAHEALRFVGGEA